jgi:hypothetical protein
MKKQANSTIKYCAFNTKLMEHYLCTSKTLLSKKVNCSTRTILRKELIENNFIINDWYISTNVEVHKQPKRNTNTLSVKNPL